MPKLSKKRASNKLNGRKGGYHKSFSQSFDESDEQFDDNYEDEDFLCGSQPRPNDNSSSCFFMTIMMLQTVIDATSSCDCGFK